MANEQITNMAETTSGGCDSIALTDNRFLYDKFVRKHKYSDKETSGTGLIQNFYWFLKSEMSRIPINDVTASRVIRSFMTTKPVSNGLESTDDERNIRNWLAMLLAKGSSPHTTKRYLGKLHVLYNLYKPANPDSEAFFLSLRKNIEDREIYGYLRNSQAIEALSKIANIATESSDESVKILMYAIYSGTMHLTELLDLKFSNATTDIPQINEILATMPTARRSYVFNSDRSSRLPNQLRMLADRLRSVLLRYGIYLTGSTTEDTFRILWATVALNCGIPPEQILAITGKIPQGMKWLCIVKPVELTDNERTKILRLVADSINSSTPAWFAMFMRNRTTPDEIKERITEHSAKLSENISLFYPTRPLKKIIGKKTVTIVKPVIPHILFFKTRPDCVSKIFNIIGDIAWCFKVTNKPGSQYAKIPNHEMEQFRKVAEYPGYAVKIDYEKRSDLIPDRHVRITEGMFNGYEGIIYKRKHTESEKDIQLFILRLNDKNCITWELTLPETSLLPLPADCRQKGN